MYVRIYDNPGTAIVEFSLHHMNSVTHRIHVTAINDEACRDDLSSDLGPVRRRDCALSLRKSYAA